MKTGPSSLALFAKPINEILETVTNDKFDLIELLSEGLYGPEHLLENKELLEPFYSYDLEYYIHSPNIDLNISSLNEGIRRESVRQIKRTLDLAEKINAKAITVHPGHIGRIEDRIRNYALELATESIKELMEYREGMETKLSIENMPNKPKFLGTRTEELENFVKETNCNITIDIGHANTCDNTWEFLKVSNIAYYHLSDNNGVKDQHTILGEGNLDLNLLKQVKIGVLELNTYEKVLKSRDVLNTLNLL